MGRGGSGVRVVSKSSVEISFVYKGVRCRERIALEPTPANLKRAEQWRASVLAAIEAGTFDYSVSFPGSARAALFAEPAQQSPTLASYLPRWLERIKPSLKSSTYRTHAQIVARAIAAMGRTPLADVSWRAVREWIEGQQVSAKTARNLLSVLRSALKDAMDDDLIDSNPLADRTIRRPNTAPRTDEIDPFTAEERAAILAAAAGQERNLIQFGFWTGLRISELVALDWSDIDTRRGVVRVVRAQTQAAKEPESPKTAAGAREVKLLAPALAAIEAQRAYGENGPVFRNPRTGEAWRGDVTFRQGAWTRILRDAGVRYRYPYQMRHTYASMLLMAGEAPQWVSTQLGHRDWAFTMRTYARWIESDRPDAGARAVDAWGKDGTCAVIPLSLPTTTEVKNKRLRLVTKRGSD